VKRKINSFLWLSLLVLLGGIANSFGRGSVPIEIHTEGRRVTYTMRDKEIEFSSLPERIAAASFNQKDYPVELHPDKDTTFVSTFEIILFLKRLGYTRIAVFAERGEHRWDDPLGFFFVPVDQVIDNTTKKADSETKEAPNHAVQ